MEPVAGDIPTLVTALIFALALVGIMRWVFKPSRPRSKRLGTAMGGGDLGLLEVVASSLDRRSALLTRATLTAATIRTSVSTRRDGTFDVLVFRTDAERAHEVLHSG